MIISRLIFFRIRKFSDKFVEINQKRHFKFKNFFRMSCSLYNNVEKYGRARQAIDDTLIKACVFYAGYLRIQTHTQNM
jgi:hypothetical protein